MSDRFDFRNLHPKIRIGTASDRYAGWIGQIYTGKYKVSKRAKEVGGGKVTEETVEVKCVREFFEHFGFLEIDYTFYDTLLDHQGKPTRTLRTLESYVAFMPKEARVTLKVPQKVTAHKTWVWDAELKKRVFKENPRFQDADVFTERFYKPAKELLGGRLAGLIFEYEYQRAASCPPPEENIASHEKFFSSIPEEDRYHIEERTDRLKTPDYFRFLREHQIGNVFSHWSYLPSLSKQLEQADGFSNPKIAVLRLLTPRGVKYENAYLKYFPFNELKDEDPVMIEDTVALAKKAIAEDVDAWVTVNNRAGGNAPLIAQRIRDRFREEHPGSHQNSFWAVQPMK